MNINEVGEKLLNWIERHNQTTKELWSRVESKNVEMQMVYNYNAWFDESVEDFLKGKRDFWVSEQSKSDAVVNNEMWALIYFNEDSHIIHAGYAHTLPELLDYFQIQIAPQWVLALQECIKSMLSQKDKGVMLKHYYYHPEVTGEIKSMNEDEAYWEVCGPHHSSMSNDKMSYAKSLAKLLIKKDLKPILMKMDLDEKLNIAITENKKVRKI